MTADGGKKSGGGGGGGAPPPHPKDAQVMTAILKDMGVNEFEPKVVTQLLEFSYRYVTQVLDDARSVSAHSRKKAVDVDDVRLAVQMHAEQNVTSPPAREVLLEMARARNAAPLPVPKPTCGLRLPPDRHCLTACNYKLKQQPKKPPGFGGVRAGGDGAKMAAGPAMPGFKPAAVAPNPGGVPMPKFSITQPVVGAVGGVVAPGQPPAPMFKISVAPQPQPPVTGQKRTADEMGNNIA